MAPMCTREIHYRCRTLAERPGRERAVTSDNFNLIGNGSGATLVTPAQFSDQIGSALAPVDPMLGPLADNGGST